MTAPKAPENSNSYDIRQKKPTSNLLPLYFLKEHFLFI